MDRVEMEILALSHSITQSHSYAVVLGEKGGNRRLPIVIGGFEAQAIAIAIEDIEPTRPLTHDLMKNMIDIFQIELHEVVIVKLTNGVFYAQLVCEQNGQRYEIDSRTSDAIALAARFKCPIYTFENILAEAGINLTDEDLEREAAGSGVQEEEVEPVQQEEGMAAKSTDELERLLQEALEKEDYERAAKIRDELNKRSDN